MAPFATVGVSRNSVHLRERIDRSAKKLSGKRYYSKDRAGGRGEEQLRDRTVDAGGDPRAHVSYGINRRARGRIFQGAVDSAAATPGVMHDDKRRAIRRHRPPSHVPGHKAPALRQRQKRQAEIERENERMERRLKGIRDANPHCGVNRLGRMPWRSDHGCSKSQGRPTRTACIAGRDKMFPPSAGAAGVGNPLHDHPNTTGRDPYSGKGGRANRAPDKCSGHTPTAVCGQQEREEDGGDDAYRRKENRWRVIYNQRQTLAFAVETAAADLAKERARVGALRAKTLWTEANARR